MLNLTDIMAPYADQPKQVKFTISETAHVRLRQASKACGQDMSTLVDMLIRTQLQLPGEAAQPAVDPEIEPELPLEPHPEAKQRERYKKDYVFGQ